MGQKVNPIAFRLGIGNNRWGSIWYAEPAQYVVNIAEDVAIRGHIMKHLRHAGISSVEIKRCGGATAVSICASRPGVIIGKHGADIDGLNKTLSKLTASRLELDIAEVRKPDMDAAIIADGVAQQIAKRMPFRRVMKKVKQMAMKSGAKGIKVACSGRLGGAEIARTEWSIDGSIPLHTIRANIAYAFREAITTYGVIGIKVWVYL